MAFTQADLDAMDRAIVSGNSMVRLPDGTTIQTSGIEDLMKRRAFIAANLDAATSSPSVHRQLQVFTDKGL